MTIIHRPRDAFASRRPSSKDAPTKAQLAAMIRAQAPTKAQGEAAVEKLVKGEAK